MKKMSMITITAIVFGLFAERVYSAGQETALKQLSTSASEAPGVSESVFSLPAVPALTPEMDARPYSLDKEAIAKEVVRYFNPLQDKLRKIILSYCDTYGDFVSGLFQLAKDKKTKIFYDDKAVYLINGKALIQFNEEKLVEEINNSLNQPTKSLALWSAAVEAAGAVYDAINAWNDHYSWPPVPDSGVANISPTNTGNNGGGSGSTYHNGQGGNSNYDVNKRVK